MHTHTHMNMCVIYTEMYINKCHVALALIATLVDKIRTCYPNTSDNNKTIKVLKNVSIIKIYF